MKLISMITARCKRRTFSRRTFSRRTFPRRTSQGRALPAMLCLVLALTVAACDLSGSDDGVDTPDIVVGNGGNFSDQNGSLSLVDRTAGTVAASQDLGGFVQGLERNGERLYVLINTFADGRIDVFERRDGALERVGQWTGLTAPRDVAFFEERAFVTGFVFGAPGSVQIVDPESGSVLGSVPVGDVPEGILAVDTGLLVANNGSLGAGRTLSHIREADLEVTTVDVPCDGPRDLARVQNDQIVVVCTGKTVFNDDFSEVLERTTGRVLLLNATTFSVVGAADLPGQAGSANGTATLTVSEASQEVFVTLSNGSIQVASASGLAAGSLSALIVPEAADGVTGTSGVAYDADRDVLLIGRLARSGGGDFPDFTAAGELHEIARSGSIVGRWTVGPAPSAVTLF